MLRSIWFLPASLAVITFLCFLNAINHPFVHDDIAFIVQNPHIGQLDHLADIFLKPSNASPVAGINTYYRPVVEVFYRLQYQLFGFHAAGFHFVNVLIHVINGLLLFALLSRLQFSKAMAYCVSLLFLIHPLQSEAVACISGISNLLTAFFVLLTLYSYVREKYLGVFLGLILALLTKEQAVILPGLLVLMDWYRQRKDKWGIWIVLIILTLGFLWLRSMITGAHMLEDILQSPGELKLRLLSIPRTIVMYLRLIVFPVDLHYYRNTDILQPNGWGFAVLGLLSAALVWFIKKKGDGKTVIFGCSWFLISLSVMLNIVPLINEYSFIMTAEHFLYLPMVGVFIVIGVIARSVSLRGQNPKQSFDPERIASSTLAPRNDMRFLVIIFSIFVIGMGAMTIYQNTFWRGEIPLFERTISFQRNFARGHILLGRAYFLNDQTSLANAHFDQALNIMKSYERKATNPTAKAFYKGFIKEIYADMAQCRMVQGKFDEAIVFFNQALEINPRDVGVLNNLAVCYIRKGDSFQAEQFLKMTLGFDPNYAPARNNLQKLMKDN